MEPLLNKRVRKSIEPPTSISRRQRFPHRPHRHRTPTLTPTKKAEPIVQVVAIARPVTASTPTLTTRARRSLTARAPTPSPSSANYPRSIGDATERSPIPPAKGATAADLDPILARNLKDYPKDVWAHLDFQMLQFLRDKPTPQLDMLAPLAAEDRELIASVMDGLSNFRNAIRADNNMLMSRKVRPFLELADRLRAQADLIIPP